MKQMKFETKYILGFSIGLFLFMSCKSVSYSTTGASIHPDCKTFSVQYIDNRALVVNPTLSNTFTEALKEKFRNQTNLDEVVNGEGDLNFEGFIVGYDVKSIDITREEIATNNRFTITVKIKYTNSIEDTFEFDTQFSAFADFSSDKDLTDVEDQLIEEIIPQIIDDIFNRSVVNW